jgi:Protein of unknown function (DUF3807)
LIAFHAKHLPDVVLPETFLQSGQPDGEEDLGFYPDGALRTLTDEQIAIFRHSEIQELVKSYQNDEEAEGQNTDLGSEPKLDDAAHSTKLLAKGPANKYLPSSHSGNPIKPSKKNKKRKRQSSSTPDSTRRDPEGFKEDGESRTYRRICRELDERKTENVELDY